mgnify:CR=1 FL=1
MRKITRQACQAFENGKNFTSNNTVVKAENNVVSMYLWGNEIAKKENGKLYINLCGYNTNTTRERLNGLSGVSVNQRNFTPYLNGAEISSYGWHEVGAV